MEDDAVLFKAEIDRRRRRDRLCALGVGDLTLAEFSEWWWRVHVLVELQPSTRVRYRQVLDGHVLARLGQLRLREISPWVVLEFRAELSEAGVAPPTARKALFLLQAIMRLAVLRGAVEHNPVQAVRKPRRQFRSITPLQPPAIEAVRRQLDTTDATLVSLLAYAGLRPGEALALRWHHVHRFSLLIDRSISHGHEKATKTNATRTVALLAPVANDLARHRQVLGAPPESWPLFARPDGQPWSNDDYRNWRTRRFRPATARAGLSDVRPYDLRHSFVSLLIQAGASVIDVARQAGHSPEECLRTYAHQFSLATTGEPQGPFGASWGAVADQIEAARIASHVEMLIRARADRESCAV